MLSLLSILPVAYLAWYWIYSKDKTLDKLNDIFKKSKLTVDEQLPTFKKKKDDTYYFKVPIGLEYSKIEDKKELFEMAFPYNKVILEFEDGWLSIMVTDDLPDKVKPVQSEGWNIPIGQSIKGMIFHNFDDIPHMLVAGMTRYGKTVLLKLIISLLIQQQPERSKFYLIDMKGGLSFVRFRKMKQTMGVATDIDTTLIWLNQVKKAVDNREKEFLDNGFEDIKEAESKGKTYDRIFVIVDEAAQLSPKGRKWDEAQKYHEAWRVLESIAQVGAGLGFRLIYCTQYPVSDTLPNQIKANCDAVLSFKLKNSTHGKVVFDESGYAENLPRIRGRAYYQTDELIEIQVPYISNEDIEKIIKPYEEDKNGPANIEAHKAGGDTAIFK